MVGSFWIDGADWREDRTDRDHEHRRSISGSRTPAQIAVAIVTRLLPPYRTELAEVRERRMKRLAGIEWEEQTTRELAAAAGGRLHAGKHNTFHADGVHGRVSDGYGVKLTLDWLGLDVARQIIELVREAHTVSEATL